MDALSKDLMKLIEKHFYATNQNRRKIKKYFMTIWYYLWHTIGFGLFLASFHETKNKTVKTTSQDYIGYSITASEAEGIGITILIINSFSILLRDDKFQWDLINAGRKLLVAIAMAAIFGGGVGAICPIICGAFSCKLMISIIYFLSCWFAVFIILTKLMADAFTSVFNFNSNTFEAGSQAEYLIIVSMFIGYIALLRCFMCEYGYICISPKFKHAYKWAKKIRKNRGEIQTIKKDLKEFKKNQMLIEKQEKALKVQVANAAKKKAQTEMAKVQKDSPNMYPQQSSHV